MGSKVKLFSLLAGLVFLYACECQVPKVAEKEAQAAPAKTEVQAEPDCCKKLENELNALRLEVNALKSQLEALKVDAKEAKEAVKEAVEKAQSAANRAEEAAKKAEASAMKAERIFEKGLKK